MTFEGVERIIPDVYATTRVVNQASPVPPEFNIALIIGEGDRGQPYDYTTTPPVKLMEQQNEVNDEYGKDSDIAQAFEYFKKHGGRKAYCLNASDATKGTGSLMDGGGTPAAVIDLTAANWGSYSAGINIEIDNDTTVVITISDPDDSGIKIISPELTTLAECITWINEHASQYFTAALHAGGTLLPADFNGLFSTTNSYVAGTNPAPTTTDYDNIIAALPPWIDEYDIRLICPVIDLVTASQHAQIEAFRDLAISQRTAGKPIQIICGGLASETSLVAGDTTSPNYRAEQYNSQEVLLITPGIDSLAPYISSAPALLGLLNGNNIAHNLTRDDIVASTLETKFTSSQLETLIEAGVNVITFDKNGYYIAKGINTLQDNTYTWNVDTKTTCLPMQRSIADYVLKYFKESLQMYIGADGVTKNQVAQKCARIWDTLVKSFDPSLFGDNSDDLLGNGLPYNTDRIQATTEGWLVYVSFVPASETNFIGLLVAVTVGY